MRTLRPTRPSARSGGHCRYRAKAASAVCRPLRATRPSAGSGGHCRYRAKAASAVCRPLRPHADARRKLAAASRRGRLDCGARPGPTLRPSDAGYKALARPRVCPGHAPLEKLAAGWRLHFAGQTTQHAWPAPFRHHPAGGLEAAGRAGMSARAPAGRRLRLQAFASAAAS